MNNIKINDIIILNSKVTTTVKDLNKAEPKLTKKKQTDFDDVLAYAGEFGLYQLYLFLITIPFYFYLAFVYYSQIFITETPDKHWCWIPELANLTVEERMSLAIPLDNSSSFGFSRCHSYVANWSNLLETGGSLIPGNEIVKCQHGWEFDRSDITYPTISSEYGWVCEKDNYQATAQSIFFCGAIVGGFILGNIADHFGRIPACVLANMAGCIGGIASVFVTNFTQFAICRFIMGLGYDNIVTMVYILVIEYTAPKYRSLMANISFGLIYSTGAAILPWLALACGHWKYFALATSIPVALAALSPLVIPESPRWLLSKGKTDITVDILKRIAAVNKKTIPDNVIEEFRVSSGQKKLQHRVSLLNLVRRPPLLRMLLCVTLLFMCCDIVFDALVRVSGKVGYNFAISYTLSSFTECPSVIILLLIVERVGRRWLTSGCLLICGFFSILGAYLPLGLPSMISTVMARLFVNISYSVTMQWAAEMLPTEVRGSGVTFMHISAYCAVMLSPFIVYLEKIGTWLPLLVIGLVAITGGLTSLFLPETTNKSMPQTFEEAEDLIRSNKFWSLPRKDKKMQSS